MNRIRFEERDGSLTIHQPTLARLVLGTLLVALGVYLHRLGQSHGLTQELGYQLTGLIGLLLLMGCAMTGYRCGMRIDARSREIGRWRRMGKLFEGEPVSLDAFDEVSLRSVVTRSSEGNSGQVRYRVDLVGTQRFPLFNQSTHEEARRLAERVARFVALPLRSEIGGVESLREPDQLDLGLAEQWRARGEVPERPAPPAGTALVVRESAGGVEIELPPASLSRSGLLLALPMLLPLLALGVFWLGPLARAPWLVQGIFGSILAIPVLVVLGLTLPTALGSWRVTASPAAVIVTRRLPGWQRTTRFPGDDLEEILVPRPRQTPLVGLVPTPGLLLISDDRMLRVGKGAAEQDLGYLAGLIEHALCAEPCLAAS